MKKIFTLIAALTLCAGLFAQAGETELFVAANASVDHTWGQFENPEATWDAPSGVLSIEIKAQSEWQWGNQVYLATGITTLDVTKEYQVSFDIVASTVNCDAVTFKAFDDNQIAWANQNISVTDVAQTWTSEWTKAPAATANGLMVWDFGWDPEQTITISNISIKERDAQAPAPYLFVDGIVTINELKEGETIYFQYFNYDNGKRVNGIDGNTNRNKSFEPYTTEGYCEIHYTNKDNVERNFIVNPKIENAVDSIYQGETYLFADTLLTTAGTYQRTIESNTMTLTLKVKQKPIKYTTYANWQIKYGNTWEWSDNMEKVEDGLFKLEILWEGTGFNVKSDENPIKKDWFAPEELFIGEEVIAPVTVDVYLRVIDDETLKIGIGVVPASGPTVDETGITVNGRKYGFPVRLVKEVK